MSEDPTKERIFTETRTLWFSGVVIVASLFILTTAGGKQEQRNAPSSPVMSGGYSIFHETMVDMPWTAVEEAAEEGAIVLFPTGVIEEHGPHMGCGIDVYGSYLACKLTRRELESRGIRTVIAPPFYWGINATTHVFPGTFTVRPETMKALIHDIMSSLKQAGFTKVFNINGHLDGHHCVTVVQAMRDAREALGMEALCVLAEDVLSRFGLTGEEPFVLAHDSPPESEASSEFLDLHAGAHETGLIAAYLPEQVDEDLARSLAPTKMTRQNIGEWVRDARKATPMGYVGDPANFSVEEARESWIESCLTIADAIESFLEER